jgi:predicted extracellular nuclease
MRVLLAAVAALLIFSAPASGASTTLVINEVDYDQPGTDAAEFLEIKNVATTAINLDPYQLRFVNGADGLNYRTVNLPAVSLAEGDHYVVCGNAANTANCDLDMTPDTNLIQNGDPDGVVLEIATGAVDSLAYGPGPMAGVTETANATFDNSANAGQGLARVPDGCDTDNNSTDFQRAAITPGASNGGVACGGPPADSAPSVASSNPATGAVDVPLNADLSVTFSEPVNVDANAFALSCAGGSHGLTVTGGPTTFTLDPAGTFAEAEECTLTVEADAVHDQDGADPPDTMAADAAIPFTTVAQVVRIRQIQGTSHLSPLMNELVSHVPGVVTARRLNGFFMQDATPDNDASTSEGMFVFTGAAPAASIAVGKAVTVSGRVSEFRPVLRPGDLTLTEIVQPTVTVGDDGPDITPTLIGSGGRVPPGRIIDNDSLGDVELASLFDPEEDGIDFYESLEGMFVRVADPLVVGPTAPPNIGELPIVGDGGRFAGPRTARGGVLVERQRPAEHRRRRRRLLVQQLQAPGHRASRGVRQRPGEGGHRGARSARAVRGLVQRREPDAGGFRPA